MKIAICCNHSYPHVGGSEIVIQKIAESLTKFYNHKISILSKTVENISFHEYKNITYYKVDENYNKFFQTIENIKPDIIFVYSDYFIHWQSILLNIDKYKSKIFIALVGANYTRSSETNKDIFVKKSNKIKIITHSDNYEDSSFCKENLLNYSIIPNFIDMEEFNIDMSFKIKYNIPKEKEIILNVANFFPGKGQEYIPEILSYINMKNKIFVSIASREPLLYAKTASLRVESALSKKNIPFLLLKDIPREAVIASFKESKIFLFSSQKEVAPLVILEAQAAGLPWVSMDVGNLKELNGGIFARAKSYNDFGLIPDCKDFATNIQYLLQNQDQCEKYSKLGKEQISSNFRLEEISKKYDVLFKESII